MDDAVGVRGRLGEPVEIGEVTAVHRRAIRGYGRRGRVGSREAYDVVPRGDEFGDDSGTEMAGCSGDEDAHLLLLRVRAYGPNSDETQSHHYSK